MRYYTNKPLPASRLPFMKTHPTPVNYYITQEGQGNIFKRSLRKIADFLLRNPDIDNYILKLNTNMYKIIKITDEKSKDARYRIEILFHCYAKAPQAILKIVPLPAGDWYEIPESVLNEINISTILEAESTISRGFTHNGRRLMIHNEFITDKSDIFIRVIDTGDILEFMSINDGL